MLQNTILSPLSPNSPDIITSLTSPTLPAQSGAQELQLLSVYVPTNHVYIGDVFLMEEKDVIHTNLSVREGLEVVVSVGMAVPPTLIATKGGSLLP